MKKRQANTTFVTALFVVVWHVARALPLTAAKRFMFWLLRTFSTTFTNQRAIRRNLSIAFPELDEQARDELARTIAGNFGNLAAELIHLEEFRNERRGYRLRSGGDDTFAHPRPGPVIYVGPHAGNWELVPVFFERQGIKTTIIHSSVGNALIDDYLLAARHRTGAEYVEKTKALRAVFAALEAGRSIALLVDQRVPTGEEVTFFGHRVVVTNLPARLARRFGCPIVPMEGVREGRTIFVHFKDPIYATDKDGRELGDSEITQRMMHAVEDSIRKSPDDWFCNKRRWRKDVLPAPPRKP